MLKYNDIIGRLSLSQKIRMLCDIEALSQQEYRALGIPAVNVRYLEDEAEGKYPSPYALSNSWNTELVGEVAKATAKEAAAKNTSIVIIPGAKAKITPYSAALSEDIVLSSALAGEYLGAVAERGMSACIKDFSVTAEDVDWMDILPNTRSIYENIVKPVKLTAKYGKFAGMTVSADLKNNNYEYVNRGLIKIATENEDFSGAVPLCEKADMTETVSCIANSAICLKGASIALESALNKYKQMKKSVAFGNISEQELEAEISNFRAISPETIDVAVDRLIEFAFINKRERILLSPTVEAENSLALKAAKESIVLLKNNKNLLPVTKKSTLCIVGDIVMDEGAGNFSTELSEKLSEKGYKMMGMERGYNLYSDRSEELLQPAMDLARTADTVLLFLGFDKKREKRIYKNHKLSLPANQQILLEKLGELGKKIVVVVSSNYAADIVIDEKADALVFATVNTFASAQALAEMLAGEFSPCGKLSCSVYVNSDTYLKKQKVYKTRYGMKTGPFVGYKYYDTAEFYPGYPFGHGLGYVDFAYSRLAVNEGMATFTIKNTGKMTASEVVQLYVGMNTSAVIRPRKALSSFVKITLSPGEKKTVSLPVNLPEIFDVESKEFVTESGTYTVYIGSSVKDIRLSCEIKAGSKALTPDGEIKSDYLQSESNIISDNYKLEANCDTMRKSVINIIAGVTSLLLAVILKTFCVLSNNTAALFDVIAAILAVMGWVFFVTEIVARKKEKKAEEANVAEANEKSFANADQLAISNAEQLFVKEFDVAEEEDAMENTVHDYSSDISADNLIYVDNEQTFASATKDFIEAALERGYSFEPSVVNRIFASMASSRVIMVNGMSESDFRAFMLILGNYFESSVFVDNADESYISHESLLFSIDAQQGTRTKTNMFLAIESAKSATHKIHLAGINNAKFDNMQNYFAPVAKYAKNPYAYYTFSAHNEQNIETTYVLPQNLWVIVNLAEGENLGEIHGNIAEISTVNTFAFKECPASNSHAIIHPFSYYQMEYLTEKVLSKLDINEDIWKKIDKLEAYVNAHDTYHIGNKLWLCLEKYVATLTSCDVYENEAVDSGVAAKLLPTMITVLNGKISKEEVGFAETVETIFGEDNVSACKKIIKTCGADVK